MAAVTAAQPQEAVGQDAAFEEGDEFVLARCAAGGSGSGFGRTQLDERRWAQLCRALGRPPVPGLMTA